MDDPVLILWGMGISGILMTVLYGVSVSPARLERLWGARAYPLCGWLRGLSMVSMGVVFLTYYLYSRHPLDLFLPDSLPIRYDAAVTLALAIGLPSFGLMVKGTLDAGAEAVVPDKRHTMYPGIYRYIRHPQALGELPLWFVAALFFNSLHLLLFSFIWIPVWYGWCWAEERDLVLRYGEAYRQYQQQTGMFFPKRR